jgi:hypothetical protein
VKKAIVASIIFILTAGIVWAASNAPTFLNENGEPEGANGAFLLSTGTPVSASSGNVANAAAVATLAGVADKTTYVTGFRCGGSGSTAAAIVNITVAGLLGGTQTYTMISVAGATLANTPVSREFTRPVPASAVNTAIVVTMPALGAGNTNASCNAEGFQY